jgi:hypothetical protein
MYNVGVDKENGPAETAISRDPAHTDLEVIVDSKSLAQPRTEVTVDEAIRRDAAVHPERSYREHVEAAEEIAAVFYRAEIRAMMKAGTLDD